MTGLHPRSLHKLPPHYRPSQTMLNEVGLDFDGDLGGLKKGPPLQRPRLHPVWVCVALSIPILMICVNPAYGVFFVSGAAFGVFGMLVRDAAHR